MDEKRQIQKELFEEFADTQRKRQSKILFQPGSKRTITLTYEHLIFIVMAVIITAIAFFSLGVERGKRLKAESATLARRKSEQAPLQIEVLPKQIKEEQVAKVEEVPVPPQPKEALKEGPDYAYTIQVASYVNKNQAEAEALRLEKRGFKPLVFSSGKYYVVCAGEFENKSKADSAKKGLRKFYSDCFVKKK